MSVLAAQQTHSKNHTDNKRHESIGKQQLVTIKQIMPNHRNGNTYEKPLLYKIRRKRVSKKHFIVDYELASK